MKGRRITKDAQQRTEDLRAYFQRSGFTGMELLQIMVDWYGWREVTVYLATARHTITNSMQAGDSQNDPPGSR